YTWAIPYPLPPHPRQTIANTRLPHSRSAIPKGCPAAPYRPCSPAPLQNQSLYLDTVLSVHTICCSSPPHFETAYRPAAPPAQTPSARTGQPVSGSLRPPSSPRCWPAAFLSAAWSACPPSWSPVFH